MMTLSDARAQGWPAMRGDERGQLLHRWNDTRAEFPQVCAHELFELQVARDPGAVALEFGERRISPAWCTFRWSE